MIRAGDRFCQRGERRITETSVTGSTTSKLVNVELTILVRSTSFDPQASTLRVSGQVDEESYYVAIGQYHTLDIVFYKKFTIEKADGWDSVSEKIVSEACSLRHGASAWAVIMQEGFANIAVLFRDRTVLRHRVNVAIPGKKGEEAKHSKVRSTWSCCYDMISDRRQAVEKFFSSTLETLLRCIDLSNSVPVLLASPAYTATNFRNFIIETATRTGNKKLLGYKPNFIVVHSSTGQYHSLTEVLKSPAVAKLLDDTKYARESMLMEKFFTLTRTDEGKAWYGPREVERAVTAGAVGIGGGVLLISNGLFRARDVEVRRRWVELVDRVRDTEGGEVKVLSSEHESGKRLEALGGIAAILTYPLYDLDESGDEDDDNEGVGDGTNGVAV